MASFDLLKGTQGRKKRRRILGRKGLESHCFHLIEVVRSVAASADFSRAISGSHDKTLRVWDLERGVCLASYHASAKVTSLAADFARGRMVCGCYDGQVHILTLLRGEEVVRVG